MADPMRIAHGVVVLLAVGAYSIMLIRGLNSQLTQHMYSHIEKELDKNPHMKKDYEEYKLQVEEQKRQQEQIKELEEQAKRIQEQISEMSKKQVPLKYVRMEGVNEIAIESQNNEAHLNLSKEEHAYKRIEL
ncbi:hypothetical protein SK128_024922 [Halocaridina rubra]|uniref:Uncharacterized protein n=1 Tax=Halocaridina rubra TaxID=373956 RepID=A0AAN8WPH2_HALRR